MRSLAIAVTLLLASSAFAIDDPHCAVYRQIGELYAVRGAVLSGRGIDDAINRRLESLREPVGRGEYRWVKWARPDGEGPVEKDVNTVRSTDERGGDMFDAAGGHAFAVRVVVPRKRSLMNANNAVYVGAVDIRYTVAGREKKKTERINSWMNPDTARNIDLGAIADSVDVAFDAATRKSGEAVVEIHFRSAIAVDDPANPAYDAIRTLVTVRDAYDEKSELDRQIDRAERNLFPDFEPMPLLTIIEDLRRADDLIRSKKPEEQERGAKLFRETMRRLR